MPKQNYECREYDGDNGTDGWEPIEAYDAGEAAENYAEDHELAHHEPPHEMLVEVRPPGQAEFIKKFKVTVEWDPTYNAEEITDEHEDEGVVGT